MAEKTNDMPQKRGDAIVGGNDAQRRADELCAKLAGKGKKALSVNDEEAGGGLVPPPAQGRRSEDKAAKRRR
jgi:hypothetical protein